MMNPTYKIHGKARKVLKKELSLLKAYVSTFRNEIDTDQIMCNSLGAECESTDRAEQVHEREKKRMIHLENILSEKF